MLISRRDWNEYIKRLSAINQKASDFMENWMLENPDADVEELILTAQNVASYYGDAVGALACEMYESVAEAMGVTIPPAVPAPVATYNETAKAVQGTKKNKQSTIPATVGRLVKQVGADTILQNAQRDHAQFAWIPSGDTCAFCMTLASRGWQYMSKNAMKNGHAEHIHANCDCTYAVRFDERSNVQGYDPERYERLYYDAPGYSSKDKINAMRRAQYAVETGKADSMEGAYKEEEEKGE